MAYDSFPEHEELLNETLGAQNPFVSYIERIRTKLPLGADIVGALLARMQALWDLSGSGEMGDRLLNAPGDRTLNFGDDNIPARVGLGMPIAYDIWYLFDAVNILKFGGKTISETMAKMADYFESIDDAKPLLTPESPPGPTYGGSFDGGSSVSYETFGAKEYKVKEARFETWLTGDGPAYDSNRPKDPQENYAGYIAFPVGPLGVMWKIALATGSALESGLSGRVYPVDYESSTIQGGELLPPFKLDQTKACGENLMSKGWLVDDETKVEILARDFEGIDNPELHYWLRYWIAQDNTEIIPGEMCGLLCRPWPLHCWWYQETAPLLYSGHWVETEFYTSGIVKEVILPDEDLGEIGNRYKVWVKNEEILVQSTDFYEYEVNERAGLLKTWREGAGGGNTVGPATEEPESESFTWQELVLLGTGAVLTAEWVIVPAGFYETSGSSLGGAT